jgi:hypothetical protein
MKPPIGAKGLRSSYGISEIPDKDQRTAGLNFSNFTDGTGLILSIGDTKLKMGIKATNAVRQHLISCTIIGVAAGAGRLGLSVFNKDGNTDLAQLGKSLH